MVTRRVFLMGIGIGAMGASGLLFADSKTEVAKAGASGLNGFIDTHAHAFTKALPRAAQIRYSPEYDATYDDFLAAMKPFSFDRGVLVQPSFLGFDNSYVLEAIKKYPKNFKGIAVIPEDTPFEEMKKLKSQGIEGIRLNLFGKELPDFKTPVWQTCLKNLEALKWQLELHVPAKEYPKLLPHLEKFKINIVIDHMGRFDPKLGIKDEGFEYLVSYPKKENIWFKCSGFYRLGKGEIGHKNAVEAFDALKKAYGIEKFVWGSDWPHTQNEKEITYKTSFEFIENFKLTPKEKELVLKTNAIKLFNF